MDAHAEAVWHEIVQHEADLADEPENSCATWSLSFGIASLAGCLNMTLLPVALPMAGAAFALGLLGRRAAQHRLGFGRTRASVGIVLSLVPLGCAVLLLVLAGGFLLTA